MAEALAAGRLVAFRDEPEPTLFDEEEIVDLHDLIDPDARDDEHHPIDPTPAEPELTWLSFEVVDDRGHRLDGIYVCTIDGTPEEAPLAREKHAYEDLRESARADLELKLLDLSPEDRLGPVYPEGLEPDGGSGTPDDSGHEGADAIDPSAQTGITTFEVVDDEGRPFNGEYELTGSSNLSGPLTPRIDLPDATAPLRLQLRALAPALLG